jgi:hypothetical protein
MNVSNPNPLSNTVSEYRLRCGSCGAPYSGRTEGEILTCGYCGTTQRTVDARQFLDHFMAQVTAFVRQAVPPGLDVSHSESIDPVARLAAFNMSVRPRLSTQSDTYRFSCFNLLSSPLAVFPFSTASVPVGGADPAAVSIFAAQVQSVSGLAVDNASRELVGRAGGLASCYQSLLVATRLASGTQPERFHLISQNYTTASKAIESTGRWSPLTLRLKALSIESEAVDLYLSGRDYGEARRLLGTAGAQLSEAQSLLSATPELGYMSTAVDQELAGVRMVGSMLTISDLSAGVAPHPLAYSQRLTGVLDWLSQASPPDWAPNFKSLRLREEVFRRAAELRAAQAGAGSVRVLSTGGGSFVPFWVVELPYTFETGIAWTKRGKEVPETLLVAATFPTDVSSLSGSGSVRVLTDVFVGMRGGRSMNKYTDRLRGREQKISESGGLVAMLQNVTTSPVPGQQAVPPFTTEVEALRLVQSYVESIRSTDPKIAAQLRASSPRILDLVYLPSVPHSSPPVPWLGPLSPASLGDSQALLGFIS